MLVIDVEDGTQYTKGRAERLVSAYCPSMTIHKPLRVALICRLAVFGRLDGIGWYIEQITKQLANDAPDLSLMLLFDRTPHPSLIPKGASAHSLGLPARHPILWWLWFECSVRQWVYRNKPDVLVSLEGFLPSSVPCPMVTVIHDVAFEHIGGHMKPIHRAYYRWKIPQAIRRAARVCAVSDYTRRDIASTYGTADDAVDVVNNGVRAMFRPAETTIQPQCVQSLTHGDAYWLFVGTLQPRKNIVGMLDAFERFVQSVEQPGLLVLAGKKGWMDDEISEALERSRVRDRIRQTGWINDETLAEYYRYARGLIFVPFLEGFGVPIIEAFASGVPVVASNTSSLPEVAGDAAELVDPSSIDDVARGMVRVWTDESYRSELIERGKIRVKEYQWPRIASKFADIIREAASLQR
jgi:glycosyltransferase involved in cell wall biosynthesis